MRPTEKPATIISVIAQRFALSESCVSSNAKSIVGYDLT
jgi:hypothetical protein